MNYRSAQGVRDRTNNSEIRMRAFIRASAKKNLMLLDRVEVGILGLASNGSKAVIEERREFQRLNLTKPLDGWFGDFSVLVVEVSASGAKIVHDEELPMDSRGLLRFSWRGHELEILSQITRSEGARSGVHFLEKNAEVRSLITDSVNEVLRAQEANAAGDRARNVVGDETLTSASAGLRGASGFLQYHLTDAGWKCHRVLLPDQPEDGFTVSANELQEQIDLLCTTYATGDGEAKRMTRMIAELSVTR